MSNAIVFTKSGCGYCKKAKDLLAKNSTVYQEVLVTDANKEFIYSKLDNYTESYRTFPMIFISGKFIGGYTDLEKIMS